MIVMLIANAMARKTEIIDINGELKKDNELVISFGSCFRIFNYHNDIFAVIEKNEP